MKRRLTVFALLAALALLVAGASEAEVLQRGDLRVKFNADFDPHALPREHPAPVDVKILGAISTTDGSHPPPLRWMEVELNRNGHVASAGLPVCSAALLQSTSTEQAASRCGDAVVGHGRFKAEVLLGGEVPASGRILAFNSRLNGKPALLLHFFAHVPIRFTLVVPLRIAHKSMGEFGTLLRARIPRIAGGLSSITEIDLTIGRRYSAGGKRRSYVSAACSAPAALNGAVFSFARARFRFDGHPEIRSKLVDSCQVRS
jgi:hypothetical protein